MDTFWPALNGQAESFGPQFETRIELSLPYLNALEQLVNLALSMTDRQPDTIRTRRTALEMNILMAEKFSWNF